MADLAKSKSHPQLAPLGVRFGAAVIDRVVPGLLFGIWYLLVDRTDADLLMTLLFGFLLAGWVVWQWWNYAIRKAGIGYRLLGLELVGLKDGKPIGWWRMFIRSLILNACWALVLPGIALCIFLVIHERRQGWHDLAVGSVTIAASNAASKRNSYPGATYQGASYQGGSSTSSFAPTANGTERRTSTAVALPPHLRAADPNARFANVPEVPAGPIQHVPSGSSAYGPQGQANGYGPQGQANGYPSQGPANAHAPQGGAYSYPPQGQAYADPAAQSQQAVIGQLPDWNARPQAAANQPARRAPETSAYGQSMPSPASNWQSNSQATQSFQPTGQGPAGAATWSAASQPQADPSNAAWGAAAEPQPSASNQPRAEYAQPQGEASWSAAQGLQGGSGPTVTGTPLAPNKTVRFKARTADDIPSNDYGGTRMTKPGANARPANEGWKVRLDNGVDMPVRSVLLIGRRPQAKEQEIDVDVLPVGEPDGSVSKTHLMITVDDRGCFITDRGSTNGTALVVENGELVPCEPHREVRVTEGQIVSIGERSLKVLRSPVRS